MPPDQLTLTFAPLADPTRRSILTRLAEGEATVNELAEPFAVSLPREAPLVASGQPEAAQAPSVSVHPIAAAPKDPRDLGGLQQTNLTARCPGGRAEQLNELFG